MRTSITALLLALYALLLTRTGAVAATNLITNGDFQTGDLTGWTVTTAASGSQIGVITPSSGPDLTFGAGFGATDVFFDKISQTFATTPGAFYQLTFFYEPLPGGRQPPAFNGFDVLWNGVSVDNGLFPQFDVNPGFATFTFTEQATGALTTVEFDGRNQPSFDFLDNVSVRAVVPDTGTSVALLAIGLIGVAATRRVLA